MGVNVSEAQEIEANLEMAFHGGSSRRSALRVNSIAVLDFATFALRGAVEYEEANVSSGRSENLL
jgi:hypothetical protein